MNFAHEYTVVKLNVKVRTQTGLSNKGGKMKFVGLKVALSTAFSNQKAALD